MPTLSTLSCNGPGSDLELMHAAQRGSVAAFSEVYDRYAPKVLRVALQLMKTHADAQDLLHDVFLEAWQHVREYDIARGSVSTWLLVRTRSRALDRLSAAARDRARSGDALEASPRASDAARWDGERDLAVRQALVTLDAGARNALELTFFMGLTAREIAERIQVPEGTVKSRLARGLSRMSEVLQAQSVARSVA